jgi:hypothetical protein
MRSGEIRILDMVPLQEVISFRQRSQDTTGGRVIHD